MFLIHVCIVEPFFLVCVLSVISTYSKLQDTENEVVSSGNSKISRFDLQR